MYERPLPTRDATILVVKGTYTDPDTGTSYTGYYKIDMMDGGAYLPIMRNFRYEIRITKVNRKGAASVANAISGAGSGDISADISTASQTNLSDGKSALSVSYTELTVPNGGTYTLGVSFVPDVVGHPDEEDNSLITWQLGAAGSTGAVIADEGDVSYDSTTGTMTFTTTAVDEVNTKKQTIRVIGTSATSRLYRDVTICLLPQQEMEVSCISEIEAEAGTPQTLTVRIPKDLPESIFPLQFRIEASAKTLTPSAGDLPVDPGTTIVSGQSGNSFQFIKTLTRAQYLDGYSGIYSYFTCQFKSIVPVSDSDIYVANKFFATGSTSFTTYEKRYFSSLRFSRSNAVNEDDPVNFFFVMDAGHDTADKLIPDNVDVYLTGLVPDYDNYPDELAYQSSNHYIYHVPSPGTGTQTLHLLSTGKTSQYGVELAASHYEDAQKINNAEYYKLNLASGAYGWTTSSVNPDSDTYDSYQSNNHNVASSIATMKITVVGYTEFTVYVRSYAESTYDYVVVRKIGSAALTSWTAGSAYNDSGTKAHTRSNQQSGTAIGNYTAVTFTTADGLTDDDTPHTFYIQYGKDGSTNTGEDRGYVLIPKEYNGRIVNSGSITVNTTSSNFTTSNREKTFESLVTVSFDSLTNVATGYVTVPSTTYSVSVASGYHITGIVFTYYSSSIFMSTTYYTPDSVSASAGSYSGSTSSTSATWTPADDSTGSVTFTTTKRDNTDTRLVSMVVSYEED